MLYYAVILYHISGKGLRYLALKGFKDLVVVWK